MRYLVAALMLLPAAPALGFEGPPGIAFVQAPEQGSGMALATSPEAGLAEATAQCMESGALAEDCIPTNWCQPAGWTVDIFVMHEAGLHWHEVVCGLPSRPVAMRVAEVLCDSELRPEIIDCMLAQIFDPAGEPRPYD
ncbi:MAG: hypothetical protein ACK4LQ_09880 [Pararhodobacter sp.]